MKLYIDWTSGNLYGTPVICGGSDSPCLQAGMTQLLRSVLARNAKEAAVSIGPLAPAKDTAKLKKHLSLVSMHG
jgi:hypothetical protein